MHWMTPIFGLAVLISMYIPFLERFILYALCIATTFSHWHYGAKVVQQMCDHFNRVCFSVHPARPVSANATKPIVSTDDSH